MGKGKKKTKGKKREGKTVRDDTGVVLLRDDTGVVLLRADTGVALRVTQEQMERARLAASYRTEDPLKNWTRLQNEECPICILPLYPFACFLYLMEHLVSIIVLPVVKKYVGAARLVLSAR